MENTHNFFVPPKNLAGVGAIKDLPLELKHWKLHKALIVCDKNMIKLGYVNNIETILKNLFISYDIFDGILDVNPKVSYIEDGLSYFKKGMNVLKRKYKFIISIGGGTNHDCAKSISAVASNGGSITDYEGYNKVTKPVIPVIAINTSSGSGSDVSQTVIVTDESRKVKMNITSPELLPYISVNDPIFLQSMPKDVTVSSGFDVASHAIEAYSATEASPITDSLALGALKLVIEYLPRAYENGNDLEAREKMMYAAMMAGMAFTNAGLGYVHALAHQLGGFYDQVHGYNNGVLLPYVLEFNAPSIPDERIIKICEIVCGEKASNKTKAVDKIMNFLKKFSLDLGMPQNLTELGLVDEDIDSIAQNALKDITCFTNPRQGTAEDMVHILNNAK